MIISHKYKYLFVELPHTASTAISKELRDLYDGEAILRKHSRYHDFLRQATPAEKSYFVFSGLRNPLDTIVTGYLKYKHNAGNFYTDPKNWQRNGGFVSETALKTYRTIQQEDLSFEDYFRQVRWPYDNWSNLAHRSFDAIIRFENLQDDFAAVLKQLGIEQVRPLPVVNATTNKSKDFWSYYTPAIRGHAIFVGGPFCERWGYAFPAEWGDVRIPWQAWAIFFALGLVRKFRWRYVT